jgi:D-3-phosphoglycerate dehydrogenase
MKRFVDANAKIKILLLEGIHPSAQKKLEAAGYSVKMLNTALSENELIEQAKGFQLLGIRSKTQINAKTLDALTDLIGIGAFCIGTDQIDLGEANRLGIPVFNAPHANTRSVAEMVIAQMINLSRRLGDANIKAHQGGWLKSAVGSFEIRGKTLGIVGYGHIGSQVSVLAEALGMKVLFFDVLKKLPLGNAQNAGTLENLLKAADFVTLHVPDTALTLNMINAKTITHMKKGAYVINASRGRVVDVPALAAAITNQHIAGAAIDVFPKEPANNKESFESELRNLSNVILTPHIGGSTEEAQEAIGSEVGDSFLKHLLAGSTYGAVNFPQIEFPGELNTSAETKVVRILNCHKNVPGVLKSINALISESGVNIKKQTLSTDQSVGYLVVDIEIKTASSLPNELAKKIAGLDTSILTRVIAG